MKRKLDPAKEEAMRKEAVTLMKNLGLRPEVIIEFEENGKVLMGVEGGRPQELDEAEKGMIAEFEEMGNYIVYHVLEGGVDGIGYCVNLLYVGEYEEGYALMEYEAKRSMAIAYVNNMNFPEDSESGFITIGVNLYMNHYRLE